MQSTSTCTRTRDACTAQPRTNRTVVSPLFDRTRTSGRSCAPPPLFSAPLLLPHAFAVLSALLPAGDPELEPHCT
eukprot:7387079-Prymnesium_polylepis.1